MAGALILYPVGTAKAKNSGTVYSVSCEQGVSPMAAEVLSNGFVRWVSRLVANEDGEALGELIDGKEVKFGFQYHKERETAEAQLAEELKSRVQRELDHRNTAVRNLETVLNAARQFGVDIDAEDASIVRLKMEHSIVF